VLTISQYRNQEIACCPAVMLSSVYDNDIFTAETIILFSDYGHVVLPGADEVLDVDLRNSWNVERTRVLQDPEGERAYFSHSLNCNMNVGGHGAFNF